MISKILLFHKPKSSVVTWHDERNRRTVYDLLPAWVRGDNWIPVGRLDRDTRGLLLFVQDGKLMDLLSAPGNLRKEYEVLIRGRVTDDHKKELLNGVQTAIGPLTCVSLTILGYSGPRTRASVVLEEGKNRQIRRMFGALKDPLKGTALKVMDVKRVAFGPITLDVPSGQWRFLSKEETNALLKLVLKS